MVFQVGVVFLQAGRAALWRAASPYPFGRRLSGKSRKGSWAMLNKQTVSRSSCSLLHVSVGFRCFGVEIQKLP